MRSLPIRKKDYNRPLLGIVKIKFYVERREGDSSPTFANA
jgi:hypothetical protein